jgi:hypothetical protein
VTQALEQARDHLRELKKGHGVIEHDRRHRRETR